MDIIKVSSSNLVISTRRDLRRKKQYGYQVKMLEDDVKEWWTVDDLEPYIVDVGTLTAVESMEELPRLGDRVYASWENSDEWYYGRVENIVDGTWKIRYDDGMLGSVDSKTNIQFIYRPVVPVRVL